MRSSARTLLTVFALAAGVLEVVLTAQGAEKLYADLMAQEAGLREELDVTPSHESQPSEEASADLIRRVRATVASYEDAARQFPRSGYSDNALWQAAVLSADAFWQFGDDRDRVAATRLFARLKAGFPTSSLIPRIAGHTSRLQGAATAADASAAITASASTTATLRAIRREVLPDALRITLEIEQEATFVEERLDAPLRVSVDLRDTQAVEALKDATITFPDDVVRRARVGRQPGNRTRVVFDLQGAGRHSVYSLYNPYRVVIDFERTATAAKPPVPAPAAPLSSKAVPLPGTPAVPPVTPTGRGTVVDAGTPPSTASANATGGFSMSRQLGLGVARVVIDPGHGGRDPGAQTRELNEAEVVLDIALELERLLAKEPNVEVVLTRRTNVYVSLEERTAMANKSGADLFLSIHVNASANQAARGFETYFLNFASNPEAEALAARENAGSAKTMSSLPEIVKAITLNNKIDESRDFASMVQKSLQERLRRADPGAKNLGVKQAPFMVLIGATMPSVLVEVSFMTNRNEATLLRSDSHRRHLAEALRAGIMSYQRSLKKTPALRSAF
jgi:N-acetylmuramoyl-L-alanine amidase